ncbi:hypothetical protein [Umezawaea sp. Da 62-37]|uniref:hypothetical protein n=1 Tax=Umezawaea sp. Da 62-37 TaxID=3075927 RepID=UPI0028F6EF68|nr:hypothetical protein [Umezawaea sp. Da 62-37]WNV89107.1 hypothetical protein RM788_12630 [Umezawaea sp. Da 62-37]
MGQPAVPADELDGFVDRLARDIAALPEGVIAAAKAAIRPEDLAEGLLREHDAWVGQVFRPAAGRLIGGGLAHGAQTRDGERDLEGMLRGLWSPAPPEGGGRRAVGGVRRRRGGCRRRR